MSVTDQYLQNNEAYAAQFSGPLPLPPASHVAVVACMDARAAQSRLVAATIRVVSGLRTWTSACRVSLS